MSRIAVLVDVHNMFFSAKFMKNGKLDYNKLLDYVADGRDVSRAVAYVVKKTETHQGKFVSALRQFGYDVKVKDITTKHGSWNVSIAVDAICAADKVDTVVLVTGDGEIAPCIPVIQSKGCRVEVCGFEDSVSNQLTKRADNFYFINDDVLLESSGFESRDEESDSDADAYDQEEDDKEITDSSDEDFEDSEAFPTQRPKRLGMFD